MDKFIKKLNDLQNKKGGYTLSPLCYDNAVSILKMLSDEFPDMKILINHNNHFVIGWETECESLVLTISEKDYSHICHVFNDEIMTFSCDNDMLDKTIQRISTLKKAN